MSFNIPSTAAEKLCIKKTVKPMVAVIAAISLVASCGNAEPQSSKVQKPETAPTTIPVKTSPPGPKVIEYGDSLTVQAEPYLKGAIVRMVGGAAICDWFSQMENDAKLNPENVVVALNGNWRNNDCVRQRLGVDPSIDPIDLTIGGTTSPDDLTKIYVKDLETVRNIFGPDTRVYGVIPAPLENDDRSWALAAYEASGLPTIDTRTPLTDDNGNYSPVLPCLPNEGPEVGCNDGMVTVRGADGRHFCMVFPECPTVESAGAQRYANAINETVGAS